MTEDHAHLRINPERFKHNFDALAQIGSTGDGGVHRPALSEAHLAARRWFRERVEAEGLELKVDSAGNHSAALRSGSRPGARTLLLGSHLDSVPNGGRFDGALGVTSALEVLCTVRDAGLSLPVNLEAVDFTDEEGRFLGLMGSRAFAGLLRAEHLKALPGGRSALEEGLQRAGLTEVGLVSARRDPATLAGYLEAHVEQGPRLVDAGADIGVVTGIVGIRSYRITFLGRADHAGTMAMAGRQDASLGAAAFTLAARELVMRDFPNCVANVGQMRFEPGAYNIVPARAALGIQFRSPAAAEFDRLRDALLEQAQAEASRFGLGIETTLLDDHGPAPMHPDARQAIASACDGLGMRHIPLASGAGHDGQSLSQVTRAGMFFVPSVGGASHHPREFTEWNDCVNAANVLLQAAIRMASAGSAHAQTSTLRWISNRREREAGR